MAAVRIYSALVALRWSAVIAVATVAIAACGGERRTPAPTASPAVREDPPAAPASCRPRAVADVVLAFLSAANSGTVDPAQFFDFDAGPGWYTVGTRRGAGRVAAYDLDALRDYLAARHRRHERIRLVELRVDPGGRQGHIEFRLTREADDLGARRPIAVEGKGAFDCASRRLIAWSMSDVDADEMTGPLCPGGKRSSDHRRVVACRRA